VLAFLLLVAAPIVSQIATGGYHSCAVTSEGGVQCWGRNAQGQLGNGTFSASALAGPVTGLTSGVVSVSTGNWHSCALLTTGAVKCWGANGTGQLGNGSSVGSSTPVNVSGLGGGVAAIAGGKDHTCALLSNGGVKCWGYNGQGQLGTGTNVTYYVPTEVAGLSGGVVSVVTGLSHSCALLTTGGVKCWGTNSNGELGNGTQTLQRSPGDVLGLTSGVTALGAGGYHTCALLSTGGMKCWGHNGTGQLGDGSYNSSTAPVSVAGLGGTAVGLSLGNSHTCALLATSALQCWGYNFFGQLGTGNFTSRVVPTGVTGLASGVVGVSAGSYFTCAITDVGAVKCWGDDGYGQLGDGAAVKSNVPVGVVGLTGVDPALTAQLITFAPPGSLTVGSTVGLTATADSGLPVSFETWTAGTCSVSGANVTPLGNGLCGIRAFQAGDGTRAPAPAVGRLIPVSGGSALTISDVTVTESSVASVNATFSVTLSPASAQTVTVQARTVGASATSGVDFSPVFPTTLTFNPGSTVAFVTVQVAPDVLDEADETFITALGTPVNATIALGLGTGTIVDDDPAPTLSIQDVTVTEGDVGTVNALFNVTLSAVSGKTVTVSAATSNGTATAGSDYVAAGATTLTFNPGETTKTFSVTVNGDRLSEANETFAVGLSSASNASIFDASGLGTIADDDAVPALSINDVTVTEGNSGTTTASFTVSLSAASGQTVTVAAATSDGTALAGSDYVAAGPTTLTFAPGDTTKVFSVTVSGDAVDEPNETFAVALFSGSNATISDASGLGLIADDDAAPTLSINDVTVAEGNAGTTTGSFTVSLSAASGQTVTVAAATADGTALAGSDYVAAGPTTLTFAPGDTAKTFSVTVSGDAVDESNETFTVALFSGSNATISDASGLGTILDDDVAPAVSIGTATLITKNSARLNATVNPNGSATSAHFQYGLTDAYGLTTPSEALGSGPTISAFTASNVLVNSGGAATLSWSASGATTLTLNGSPVANPTGSQLVNPTITTTYTLLASNGSGSASRQATIAVNDGVAALGTPTITAPTAGQTVVVTGVGFSWNTVANAAGYDLRVFDFTTGATLFSGSLLGGARRPRS
jgi:alpha-tubulin suppressor-like RCC1 family protein